MKRWMALGAMAIFALAVYGCSSGGSPGGGADAGVTLDGGPAGDGGSCQTVDDCGPGTGCVNGSCENISRFDCRFSLSPIVQVEPSAIDFGSVRVGTPVERTLRVRNIGSCNLRLNEISLDPGVSPEFSCQQCRPLGTYPAILAPFDSKVVTISYNPTDVMPDTGNASVVTDDPQFPLIRIPLKSSTKDAPRILADPAELDFGYVQPGMTKTLSFEIKNVGGDTPLQIDEIKNNPLTSANYAINAPALPAFVNPNDTPQLVQVTYQPTDLAVHNESVRIASNDAQTPVVEVRVNGFSITPPDIVVDPLVINFGDVPIGQRVSRTVNINNNGGAPLTLGFSFAPLSDPSFGLNPTGIAPIAGGASGMIDVVFLPTSLGVQQANLHVGHNATGTANPVVVSVVGNGTPSSGNDVLALEMTFENGDDSFFASDLRDVDLHYRSPFFQDCSKDSPTPSWGTFGNPQWIGIGPRQEPERIVHTDPGMQDGTYAVELLYVEDCASLPVELIASLAGVGVDVIIAYLTGGAVPGGIGGVIADIIANTCFDRSASNVQVKVYINGTLSTTRTVRLSNRGDLVKVMDIVRSNGQFSVQ